jgi:hypothetical protein
VRQAKSPAQAAGQPCHEWEADSKKNDGRMIGAQRMVSGEAQRDGGQEPNGEAGNEEAPL